MPTGQFTIHPKGTRIGVWEILSYHGTEQCGTKKRSVYTVKCTACGSVVDRKRLDAMKRGSTACKVCADHTGRHTPPKTVSEEKLVEEYRFFHEHWKTVGDGGLRFPY